MALASSACSSGMDPDIKQNPHPMMRYDVTITVENAPGPFDSVSGFMQYQVADIDCVPETGGPMNAMRIPPTVNPAIVFNKIADNVYRGTVYADYFQDENYYGLGVCHWSLMAVIAELRINNLTLDPGLTADELFSQKSLKSYFVLEDYLDNSRQRSSYGVFSRPNFPPDRQKEIFTITLTTKEIAP